MNLQPRDWGAFLVSLVILGFFGGYEVAVLFWKVPKDETLASILNNLVILVAGYWIGSSSGSQSKDAIIAAQAIEKKP
jgi:predicted Na+-dependent transporter